ncbi:hypothetical protein [Rhodococcus rhodochrous]|nr:hypothetical protein [Rhodococcus rhodochrous]
MATPLVDIIDSPDREIVAGVDTHSDTHHVAVHGITGTRLDDLPVPT